MLSPHCKNWSPAGSPIETTTIERSAVLGFLMNHRKELLMLVDEDDRYLGEKENEECHLKKGCLHSAFLVMLTTNKGQLLQAKRSRKKKLWPHSWDGTVAGHFHKDESPKECIRRRIFEEIGVTCPGLEYLFKFRYQAAFKDIGFENEICHVYRADNLRPDQIKLSPDEVSESRLFSIEKLKEDIEAAPERYTPWFLLAFKRLLEI
jgi:isopentenyl-diphosphate delta-isomerase